MAAPQSFRSSFNGFNREDVVNYISFITNKHETQVNQLNTELAAVTEERDQIRQQVAESEDRSSNSADLTALQEEMAALKKQLAEKDSEICKLKDDLNEAKNTATCQQPDPDRISEELNAYRRAESMERRAREQVGQMYDKASAMLADSSLHLEHTAQKLESLEENLSRGLEELQDAIAQSREELSSTATAIGAIRPDAE